MNSLRSFSLALVAILMATTSSALACEKHQSPQQSTTQQGSTNSLNSPQQNQR
jgi:hypothetical protein